MSNVLLTPKDESGSDTPASGRLICPRCRREPHDEAPTSTGVARCVLDGYAFVQLSAFAEADGDPFLGKTVAGRYVILGRVGAGSMGTVYRARHETMGRDVAVKILRSERLCDAYAKARFVREARAMSMLASPYTVTVFDFGEIRVSDGTLLDRSTSSLPPPPSFMSGDAEELEDDGRSLYLAMEMLEGESLGQRLKKVPRIGVEEAGRIARQALLSLAEAHEKGVIHRDLKPDNLFLAKAPLGERGEVCKVLDFGIAKVLTDRPDRKRSVDALETQAGTVFGTPRYMSPEQAQGRSLDARSDLYSLGVLLYQMLVGRPPFGDEDAVVVMAHHIKTAPVSPTVAAPEANIPKPVSDLIVRALSKDPKERPASATAFITELDQALELARAEPSLRAASTPRPKPSSSPPGTMRSPPPRPPPSAPSLPGAPRATSSRPPTPRPSSSNAASPRPSSATAAAPPAAPALAPVSAPASGPVSASASGPVSASASAPVSAPTPSSPDAARPGPSSSPTTLRTAPTAPPSRGGGPLSSRPPPRSGPGSGKDVEISRDVLEPNSLSSPPPSGGVRGPKPAFVIAGALAVGVIGGAIAYSLVYTAQNRLTAVRSALSQEVGQEAGRRLSAAARDIDAASAKPPLGDDDIFVEVLSEGADVAPPPDAQGASDAGASSIPDASLPDASAGSGAAPRAPQIAPSALAPQTAPSALAPQTAPSALAPQTAPSALAPQTASPPAAPASSTRGAGGGAPGAPKKTYIRFQ
jgi:serine/threonine protein kinase